MLIKGLQKLTLLDYPERVACTVFTAGCNMRCGFCHNAPLVTKIDDSFIKEEEFFKFLENRVGVLDGVCVTGGEPLLQKDIESFLAKIKALGFLVKLDTNGTSPEILIDLVQKNLIDYVAIDIKNSPEKYALTCGLKSIDIAQIKKSVDFLINSNIDYEFRTTVTKELFTESDFEKIGQFICGAKKYFIQQFIDSGDLVCGSFSACDRKMLEKFKEIVSPFVQRVEIRGV